MKLFADLTKRAVVHGRNLGWVDSPTQGVQRRMLERDGDEVARATTIVKFVPGKTFPTHTHGGSDEKAGWCGGEEFLVLGGVFSDKIQGDYPVGCYVRHPVGSTHQPWSTPGCILFVKLRQMFDPRENLVKIDTLDSKLWQDVKENPGRKILPLFQNKITGERVWMEEWTPGLLLPWIIPQGGEEFFVIRGEFSDEDGRYDSETWVRNPISRGGEKLLRQVPQKLNSADRVTIYFKSGHLAMEANARATQGKCFGLKPSL